MPKLSAPSQKQFQFIKNYTSPASPTYDNVTRSAIAAGYSEGYAKSQAYKTLKPLAKQYLKMRDDAIVDEIDEGQFYNDLLKAAEKGIEERVKMQTKDPKMVQIQQKDQHFIAETIGKDRYSKRTETISSGKSVIPDNALNGIVDALSALAAGNKAIEPPIEVDYEVKEPENQK